jgi:glycosyltransferase involved in cell wall biosynthesis
VLETCAGLAEARTSPTVVATHSSARSLRYLQEEFADVEVLSFPRSFPQARFRSVELSRWLATHIASYDVVEIHGLHNFAVLEGVRTAWTAGVPYLCRPHGELDPYDLQKHAGQKKVFGPMVLRRVLARASGVVYTSRHECRRATTWGAHPPSFVTALPVAAPPSLDDETAFRARFGIPIGAKVVLFLGRFDRKKGLDVLLPAFAEVRRSCGDAWLALAGSGTASEEAEVRRGVVENGIGACTTLCGFLSGEARSSAFAGSDVFALPSYNENFGIAAVEAAYAGLQLVLSNNVFVYSELQHLPGVEVCEATRSACAEALEACLQRSAIAPHARSQEMHDIFGREAATKRLLSIYRDVVARRDAT